MARPLPPQIVDVLPGHFIRATPITGMGCRNHVVSAETSAGNFVVRMQRDASALHEYEKETWCMERAAAVGIPVAQPVAVGTAGGWHYFIQSRIQGTNGSLCWGDQIRIWRELGRHARAINSIAVEGFGWRLTVPGSDRFADRWARFLRHSNSQLFGDTFLIDTRLLEKQDLTRVRRRLIELRDWEFTPEFVHADLVPRNTVVSPDGVVHVIDWQSACAHRAPHQEVASSLLLVLRTEMEEAFFEGYGLAAPEVKLLRHDMDTLALLTVLARIHRLWLRRPDGWNDTIPGGQLLGALRGLLQVL